MNEKKIKKLLLLAFFLSGLTALIYQVLWMRKLSLLFGNTLFGIATILTVFMLGLGLGSLIFGRLVDKKKRPLFIYALLELGIGVYALLTPLIFSLVEKIELVLFKAPPGDFSSFHLVQLTLSVLALITPTILMGGTLPVLSKYLVRDLKKTGEEVGLLYFVNTLGAVLGTLLAAFVFISLLGVNQTIYFAAVVNILIGLVVLFVQSKIGTSEVIKGRVDKKKLEKKEVLGSETKEKAILVIYFFSGIAALSVEVVWTRVLTLILGSSVYAFSLMLAAFLLGIALGSFVISKFIKRINKPLHYFVVVEMLIGLLVLVTILLIPKLPFIFLKFYEWSGGNFGELMIFEFLISFLVMLGPALLMGAAFPLVNQIVSNRLEHLGRSVGKVYFANTIGSALGPLMAGFWLIPLLGMQKSLVLSGGLYLLVAGLAAFVFFKKWTVKLTVVLASVALMIFFWFIPSWDSAVLGSGVYIYANNLVESNPKLERRNEQLFYKEGLLATVEVERAGENNVTLVIDGKVDASTNRDMNTQLILGHLPMLLHPNPEEVLVIGLGSGITLGAVEQHPQLKTVDVVEIEPAVVEAASYFSEFNNDALKDSRLNMVIGDGRNYTLLTDKKYDVITAEPSNPWMTGNANLFTKEQFELYKSRLKPGGIMFQWAHIYKLGTEDIKTIIATFQAVFPHTTVWQEFAGGDIFLIGTEEPLKIDIDEWQAKIAQEKVENDLTRVYLDDPFLLLSYVLLNEEGAEAFSQGAKIHTDNHPVLEFQAPKGIYLDLPTVESATLEALEQFRANLFSLLQRVDDQVLQKRIALYALSRDQAMKGQVLLVREELSKKAIVEFEQALSTMPDNPPLRLRLAEIYSYLGERYFVDERYQEAEKMFLKAIEWEPDNLDNYTFIAEIYFRDNENDRAIEIYEQLLIIRPNDVSSRLNLAILYAKKGLLDKAELEFLSVIQLDPSSYLARNNLANLYVQKGEKGKAIEEYEASLKINSGQPEINKRLTKLKAGK